MAQCNSGSNSQLPVGRPHAGTWTAHVVLVVCVVDCVEFDITIGDMGGKVSVCVCVCL